MAAYRIPIACAAVIAWTVITVWGVWQPHDPTALTATVSEHIAWPIMIAGLFMFVLSRILGWTDLGLQAPTPWRSLILLLPSAIYFLIFGSMIALVGPPPASMVLFLAINTLAVGFSEEIAFRGVLFHALHTRWTLWASIGVTSLVFGSVHMINGFTTGDFVAAAVQAVTAFMSGVFFTALMLRTNSILPAMAFHALWDFLLTMIGAGKAESVVASPEHQWWTLIVPVIFILPNFLYGLWLLRKIANATPDSAGS